MHKAQQKRFNSLYQKHVSALIRQGKAATTLDFYSRAGRRIYSFFDCPPDTLQQEQFEAYPLWQDSCAVGFKSAAAWSHGTTEAVKNPMACKRCQGKMKVIGIIRRSFSSG